MNVKLFRITTGEEVVAELVSETDTTVTIQNGLVVLPTGQQVGFAAWATVIDKNHPEITVNKTHIVYIAEVDESIGEKYDQIYGSNLVTPDKKKLIL